MLEKAGRAGLAEIQARRDPRDRVGNGRSFPFSISNKKLLGAPGLTTRIKKLLGTRASLLVTRSY